MFSKFWKQLHCNSCMNKQKAILKCVLCKKTHFQWLSKDQCSNLELEKPDGIQNYLFKSRRELLRQQEVNELILRKGRDREVSWLLQLLYLNVWMNLNMGKKLKSRQSPEPQPEGGCFRERKKTEEILMENWKVSSAWQCFLPPKHTPILKQYAEGDKNIIGKPLKSKTELCCETQSTENRSWDTAKTVLSPPPKNIKTLDENTKVRAWAGGNLTFTLMCFLGVPYWMKAA